MDPEILVAAPAHPSLDGAVARFGEALRAETRWFGRRAADAPKPMPSLIRRLTADEPGLRLAAVHDGEIVGLARIDLGAPCGPELVVAVVESWRRRGVALTLVEAIIARAHAVGVERIVLHTSHRGAGWRELAATVGFRVVELGRGRIDLIHTTRPAAQSA